MSCLMQAREYVGMIDEECISHSPFSDSFFPLVIRALSLVLFADLRIIRRNRSSTESQKMERRDYR